MYIIFRSFALSFQVCARMVFPSIAIFVASIVVSALLSIITAGYAEIVVNAATSVFLSLVGIRAALYFLGDRNEPSYDMLMLYSALYGVFFKIATTAIIIIVAVASVLYTKYVLGNDYTLMDIANWDDGATLLLALHNIGANLLFVPIFYASLYASMAVPLAGAARGAGKGIASNGFFEGFGASFIPLVLIFAVSYFLQFFFNIFTAVYAIVPIFVSIMLIVANQTIPDIDVHGLILGIGSGIILLWLHSWTWAASAVAFTRFQPLRKKRQSVAPIAKHTERDIRSLRKSRE